VLLRRLSVRASVRLAVCLPLALFAFTHTNIALAGVNKPGQVCPPPEPDNLQPVAGWYTNQTPTLSAHNPDSFGHQITFTVVDDTTQQIVWTGASSGSVLPNGTGSATVGAGALQRPHVYDWYASMSCQDQGSDSGQVLYGIDSSPSVSLNGVDTSTLQPTLSINSSDPDGPYPTSFLYELSTTSNFSSDIVDEWTTATSLLVNYTTLPGGMTSLSNGTQYWWRVTADDGVGPATLSSVGTFTPAIPWPTVTSPSPLNTPTVPTLTPTISVIQADSEGDPIQFSYEVAPGPSFGATDVASSAWQGTSLPSASDPTHVTSAYVVPQQIGGNPVLVNGQTYWYRVQARHLDANGNPLGTGGAWETGTFTVGLNWLGKDGSWPFFSHGPLSVNEANGNLVVSLPGPSYAAMVGSLSAPLSYNSLESRDTGLGVGWTLGIGNQLANPPVRLVDHNVAGVTPQLDAVEVVREDGSSDYYSHSGTSTTYLSAESDTAKLTKNGDGSGWTLLDDDGSRYTFSATDSAHASVTSASLGGSATTTGGLTYSYTTSGGRLVIKTITDGAGRTLSFDWHADNACTTAIVCITGPDGVAWRLIGPDATPTAEPLTRVNDGTRDLYRVSYDGASPPRVNQLQNANDLDPTHTSLGASYNPAHDLKVTYDASNRVSTVAEEQVGPTGSSATYTWSLAYTSGGTTDASLHHGGQRTAFGSTALTLPCQQYVAPPAQKLCAQSPTTQNGGKTETVWYDTLGHQIERKDERPGPTGNFTLQAYVPGTDELLWSEDEDGNPTDQVWDSTSKQLASTTGPDSGQGRPVTKYYYDEAQIGANGQAGPAQTGLRAEYYDHQNLTMSSGRPVTELDGGIGTGGIDFHWPWVAGQGPAALGGSKIDDYSVRWSGYLNVPTQGSYQFQTTADDGARLMVDGNPVIDDWVNHAATSVNSPALSLTAGLHAITLEYFNNVNRGDITLSWHQPNDCSGCFSVIAGQYLEPGFGNRTSEVSPAGVVHYHHYTGSLAGAGLVAYDETADPATGPMITSYAYDSSGRVTEKVMPKGNASCSITAITGDLNCGSGPDTTYAVDSVYYAPSAVAAPPASCPTGPSVSQAGLLEHTKPNPTAPDSSTARTSYVYDAGGRALAITTGPPAALKVRCETYSAEGRLTSDAASGEDAAHKVTDTYDPAGALVTTQNGQGTNAISFKYDEAGRMADSVDAWGAETQYVYDQDSNLLSHTVAKGSIASGPVYATNLAYNAADQLTSMVDPLSKSYAFTYDTRGNLQTIQYPNSTFTWRDSNPDGTVKDIYHRHGNLASPPVLLADAHPIAEFTYAYNLDGKMHSESRHADAVSDEALSNITYDGAGRMTSLTLQNGTQRAYAYDRDSNRTTSSDTPPGQGTTTTNYNYTPATTPGVDELTSISGGTSFTYDPDGETLTKGNQTNAWDTRGRLHTSTVGTSTATYTYDALNRIIQRDGNSTRKYLYSGTDDASFFETNNNLVVDFAIEDAAGEALATYNGAPKAASTVTYQYANAHGDVVATANATGTRQNLFDYDPFGAPLQNQPANAFTEGWLGRHHKKYDTLAKLVMMGARDYDPATGRFLSVDPVAGGSLNNYDYANADPLDQTDLDGRCGCNPMLMVGICKAVPSACTQNNGPLVRAAVACKNGTGLTSIVNLFTQGYRALFSGGIKGIAGRFFRSGKDLVAPEAILAGCLGGATANAANLHIPFLTN
jgi:RHS repeat-associated protein